MLLWERCQSSYELLGQRNSLLSSESIACSQDLKYHVPSNKDKKERAYLLKDVTGYFEPGSMTALMGPSGSGKTTLLDVMAGRKTAGVTDGELLFGGSKPSRQFLRKVSSRIAKCRLHAIDSPHLLAYSTLAMWSSLTLSSVS